jgi:Flp pilus assembly protein TadG
MKAWSDDDGIATPVEMMYLLIFCIAAVLLLGFLGRLHAAGVQVTNAAQAGARAASLQPDPVSAEAAAIDAVRTGALRRRCQGVPHVHFSWQPSPNGTWQGGSVTVTVRCVISYDALAGVWAPGSRTVTMSDTQPVDKYQR